MIARGVDPADYPEDVFPMLMASVQREEIIAFLDTAFTIRASCSDPKIAAEMIRHLRTIYFVDERASQEADMNKAASELLRLAEHESFILHFGRGGATLVHREK